MPNMEQDKGKNRDEVFFPEEESPAAKRKKKRKLIRRRSRFVFTDNRHPSSGIMSAVLGLLAVSSVAAAVVMTEKAGGISPSRYAVAVVLAFIYGVSGLILGIYARTRKNIFTFFPNAGIGLSLTGILLIAGLFLLGIYAG